MPLSYAYGVYPPKEDSIRLLKHAVDVGCDHFDSAIAYGQGDNENLIGEAISDRRGQYVLASKCGIVPPPPGSGRNAMDSRPETLRRQCDESLKRLRTDVIDLYYLHRWDKVTPIEDCIGAMGDLVRAGKIKAIGVSEISAATLRKAHAVHPIAAIQSEYSLWTRNPEAGVLATCRELGVSFVAFSPVARGFFAGGMRDPSKLPANDMRLGVPRFQDEAFERNLKLVKIIDDVARKLGATPSQVALAWVLGRDPIITTIPGTTKAKHLDENLAAENLVLDAATAAMLEEAFRPDKIAGHRYGAAMQAQTDSEDEIAL
jgi:aryl-alcohol dehydrogenase-like predicted oxidoreductase